MDDHPEKRIDGLLRDAKREAHHRQVRRGASITPFKMTVEDMDLLPFGPGVLRRGR